MTDPFGPVIVEATTPQGHSIRIRQFTATQVYLETGYDRKGNERYLEIRRLYKSVRGARMAAARFFEVSLNWERPQKEA